MNFRTRYKTDKHQGWSTNKPSRCKPSHIDECDINKIVKRSEQTGLLGTMRDEARRGQQAYGDFSDPASFQDSLNLVIKAQEQFARLPSHVRDRFANDPKRFLEFASDRANAEELAKLGLMSPEAVERVKKAAEKPPKKTKGEGTPNPKEGPKEPSKP